MKMYRDLQILVAKKANVGEGQIVLDAGTGPSAFFATCLAELVGKNGLVVAVDREREYVSRIKEAIVRSGFSDVISFILADLRYIPIGDDSLNSIVSLHTLENMYGNFDDVEKEARQYIEESTRIVKSRGKVVVGTGYPVPRNRAQETFIELRLFESKLEHLLWGEQRRYFFEHEVISWFEKAGLENVEAKIIEHNIPYPRDVRKHSNERITRRLKQVKIELKRDKLQKEFHELLKKLQEHGEEWLPTLLVSGTKHK
jgi:ubiquinone/menaquinone biosynthesis C-methylase UbiE